MKFYLGDRVRISQSHHWARGVFGTICEPPSHVQQLVKDQAPWEKWHRYVRGVDSDIEFYWVTFDEPQFDADGDGPYDGAEIDARMIEPFQ